MWTVGSAPSGSSARAASSDELQSSWSGRAEADQATGQPSQQSITGPGQALNPLRPNSVTSVTSSSPGRPAERSWASLKSSPAALLALARSLGTFSGLSLYSLM